MIVPAAVVLAAAAAAPPPTCAAPDGTVVRLELALTDEERAQGLMFRDALPADRGMLFVFEADEPVAFWMKDTFIPLDLIWLSAGGEVVWVLPDVPPCRSDPCPSYAPPKAGRAVLEVNAGFAAAHGIRPGALLQFRDVPAYPVAGGKR